MFNAMPTTRSRLWQEQIKLDSFHHGLNQDDLFLNAGHLNYFGGKNSIFE